MRLLQHYVSEQSERNPHATAITWKGAHLSYGCVERRANRLAHVLVELGVERGDRVALLLPKSPLALTAMVGVLKADGAYTPVDLKNPAPRVASILAVLEPRVVLACREAAPLIEQLARGNALGPALVAWLDGAAPADLPGRAELADFDAADPEPLATRNGDGDVAHILFTSGSTGTPKGVMITHANVIAFVEWAREHFGIESSDRVSGHSPLHFDLSTFDIYGTFAAGADLHPVPVELNLLPHKLAGFMRDAALTQWFSVPSALNHMANAGVIQDGDFPALRRLIWCGEAWHAADLACWMRRLPHVRFTNLYGPTEATIASSYYDVPAIPTDEARSVPIGRACAGEELFVLDDALRPRPPEQTGELFIRGVGLSPGYWGDDVKTSAAFLPNPFTRSNDRIYRTGDLARVRVGGEVELVGRVDTQIKSRGYRIELGEIESVLRTLEELEESAVVAVDSPDISGLAIACGYTLRPGVVLERAELRSLLAARLPSYMLPAHWRQFERMPLNANGKIDRRALKQFFTAPPSTE